MDKQGASQKPKHSSVENKHPPDSSELTEENYQLLQFYEDVVQFESEVNSNIEKVTDVCSNVSKTVEQLSSSEPADVLRVGPTRALLLSELKHTVTETIPLLGGVIGGPNNLEQEVPVDDLEQTLEECEVTKQRNVEFNHIFTVLSSAIKQLGIPKEGAVADTTPESVDSLFAFSDFLGENPQVATSSPFPERVN